VKLHWRSSAAAQIWMTFDTGLPAQIHPGALGYAAPFGTKGTCIHVLLDRVRHTGSERLDGILLGHVMAHELGHVLEGIDRHSNSGVMKAHWDNQELDEMLIRPLSFSMEDVEWIHKGLARWAEQSKATPGRHGTVQQKSTRR
jgi:hypothetical protein